MIRMRRLSDRFAKIRVQDSPPDEDGSAGERDRVLDQREPGGDVGGLVLRDGG